ncbi:cyanophycinase [Telluria aromaticivorans]|uniref:Cyanophycinase n=1 Tax=Telluria aromaticivorans TaxID=2725995 RepID=A0A7Y2K1C7_9BURK|nr:cyanophycinase [Telluria aromaticivorans]NNG24800.1 cyanophycinase [Telluria aromaticivorans]
MFKRACMAALLLAIQVGAAAQDRAPAPAGSLVVIGGALRGDNAEVWERIVQLAGGKGAAIAVLPTASGNPERAARSTAAQLERHGARPFVVPVGAGLGAAPRQAAEDPALARRVAAAGGAFFTGGDQGRITAALVRPDGSRSQLLEALWSMYRRGGVIAGTSAGAAIMSSTMFYDAPPVLALLKQGVVDGKDIAPGLGFAGPELFIDQHLLVRGRFARMLPAMLAKGYRLGLGVDENSAVVLGPGRDAQVIGYKGALLLELSGAAGGPAGAAFSLSNAKISYLDSGDRIDFSSMRLVPGPDKEKLDPARPAHRGALFYPDILANTMVVDLLEKLADSDQAGATGIAFGGPAGADPGKGFEFEFRRLPETEAWLSTAGQGMSVYRMRLDVHPILLRQPLYQRQPAGKAGPG